MNNNNEIAIYYIATGPYIKYFDDLKNSLLDFMPKYHKTIILLTNSKDDFNEESDAISVKQHYIQHFCWPIVTLFKMKYILDFKEKADYVFYMNANLRWKRGFNLNLNNNLFFAQHYNESAAYRQYNLNQKMESTSYIDYFHLPNDIVYCQGAFFGGKADFVYKFCEDIYIMLQTDLMHGVIPEWHDESYLNKWLYINYWLKKQEGIEIIHLNQACVLIEKDIDKKKL